MKEYDYVIIGAGIYGLYAARTILRKDASKKVLVVEVEAEGFARGSYINQARLHNGYHYPRSYSTAAKSAKYFDRFYQEFKDEVNDGFEKIYAIASRYSWANSQQFKQFCSNLDLQCDEIEKTKFFNPHTIEKAFLTEEYSFDAKKIYKKLMTQLADLQCEFAFQTQLVAAEVEGAYYHLTDNHGNTYQTPFVLNATYAGINQVHKLFGFEPLPIKYEFCEVILCKVSDNIKDVGLTVMDGPFFSLMPFGLTGYHSITTVSRTPHFTSYEDLPDYDCYGDSNHHTAEHAKACLHCGHRPETAFGEMVQIAKKYLKEDITIEYVESLFTIKPILVASEIDDSRPTIINQYSDSPAFYSVFSGKINTMFDLDHIL